MNKKELKREVKCPKCSSRKIGLTEVSEATRIWEVENNFIDEDEAMTDIGLVLRVDGRCWDCNHKWKLRDIIQISNLFKDTIVELEEFGIKKLAQSSFTWEKCCIHNQMTIYDLLDREDSTIRCDVKIIGYLPASELTIRPRTIGKEETAIMFFSEEMEGDFWVHIGTNQLKRTLKRSDALVGVGE